uniref:PABC domain-containing protein n=1 Tax=Ananas comosus var. bracteatus TaxID=296719 RepID=A0A6V7PAX5_ANACO|nr:unnamed protein product [Ananas comosus var. bracteatus]
MARILAAAAAAGAEGGGGGGGGGGGAGARSPPTTASFSALDLDTRVSDSPPHDLLGGSGTQFQTIELMLPKQRGMLLEMDQRKVLHLPESSEALKAKVAEAIEILWNVTNQQQQTAC